MADLDDGIVRKAVVWKLKPGQAEEYEREHRSIPIPLAEEIRAQGIRNYSIYHLPETDQLFAYFEIDAASALLEFDEVEGRRWWDERMSRLFTVNPDGSAVEFPLREVFHQD